MESEKTVTGVSNRGSLKSDLLIVPLLTTLNLLCPLKRRTSGDDWEYSSLIGWKFHRKERSSDMIRRRRWRRKMAPSDRMGASAIFRLEGALVGS